MEGRSWSVILAFLPHPGKKPPCLPVRRPHPPYGVLLWACLHDRPIWRFCQKENRSDDKRPPAFSLQAPFPAASGEPTGPSLPKPLFPLLRQHPPEWKLLPQSSGAYRQGTWLHLDLD